MDIEDLLPSWERSLKARNKAPNTIATYLRAARRFQRWLGPIEVEDIDQKIVEKYVAGLVETLAPVSAEVNYKNLKLFFRWLVNEGELDRSPMERMHAPDVPDKPVPVIPDGDLKRLLEACQGKRFVDRRDAAIVRTLLDTGMRVGGLLSMTLDGLDLDNTRATIVLKGRRDHTVPFGPKTADALDRYLRSRKRHPRAGEASLWLGQRGPLTALGVEKLLARRAQRAGIGHVYPHQFRHTHAHAWLLNDGGETDLMQIMGWSSRDMLSRYARSTAHERATDAHRRMGLGDRV